MKDKYSVPENKRENKGKDTADLFDVLSLTRLCYQTGVKHLMPLFFVIAKSPVNRGLPGTSDSQMSAGYGAVFGANPVNSVPTDKKTSLWRGWFDLLR